jgi:hypothetical protein
MWSGGCDCGQQSGGCVCARSNVEVLQVAALQVGIRQTQERRPVVNISLPQLRDVPSFAVSSETSVTSGILSGITSVYRIRQVYTDCTDLIYYKPTIDFLLE